MTDEPLSVLHVAQPTTEGVARCVADLAADQVRRGWAVTVACPPTGDLPAWVADAGAIHRPWSAGRSPGPAVPAEVRRLAKIIRGVEFDLVHLHSAKAGLAGRLALRGRRPTVFQPHAWSFLAVKGVLRRAAIGWERLSARWAQAIVCVSEAERETGEAAGVRAPWRVIPNGVDLSAHAVPTPDDVAAARRALEVPSGPLVVCIGRVGEQKGQDVLLDAWPTVLEEVPAAHLAIVGDGPSLEQLRAREVPGVDFAGRREDVGTWLAAADVVAAPSRWEAGLSLVAMEAMARARSVVTTDVSGMREGLGDGGSPSPSETRTPLLGRSPAGWWIHPWPRARVRGAVVGSRPSTTRL